MKKVSDISRGTTITFSSIILRKDKKNVAKPLTDTNTHIKNYCRQKRITFIKNANIKESHLGKKKLHLNKKFFAKKLISYIKDLGGTDSLDDLVALDKCISNTLNDTEPNARSQLDNLRKGNLNKNVFLRLNINSIKGKIDVLIISESKVDYSFLDSQF